MVIQMLWDQPVSESWDLINGYGNVVRSACPWHLISGYANVVRSACPWDLIDSYGNVVR